MVYYGETGKRLNIDNPSTYNEKVQWLKLYDRNPFYGTISDKYAVRKYITETIGEEYLIPLLGVWDNVDDIVFDDLPDSFVLKCTHGSGSNIICDNKNDLDYEEAKKKLKKWIKKNWYWFGREWPYKSIKPKIIAEKYMADESGVELKDYKLYCFNGEPKLIQVSFDRFVGHKLNFYDTDWNNLPILFIFPSDPNAPIKKPARLDEMLEISRKFSKGLPHIRVDFYSIENELYLGELTLYPASGYGDFTPDKWDAEIGSWIDLSSAYGQMK